MSGGFWIGLGIVMLGICINHGLVAIARCIAVLAPPAEPRPSREVDP